MTDETTPPPDGEAPEAAAAPEKVCALCNTPVSKGNRAFVNRQIVCLACRDRLEEEVKAEQAGVTRMPMAIVGGVAGALIGAIIWAVVAVVADLEVGYVAIAVGGLAGLGTVIGAGGKKGRPLQLVAVGAAVAGLILGKYFTLAHYVINTAEGAKGMSYFDPQIVRFFTEHFGEFFDAFSILWLILALGIAWKIPMSTQLSMSRRRGS